MTTVNTEIIKTWLKTNTKDRHWLADQCGVHKQTVDGWLSAGRTIPKPAASIIQGLMNKGPSLSARLTLEEYNRAQNKASEKGQDLETWISELIKKAIQLLLIAGLLWIAACASAADSIRITPEDLTARYPSPQPGTDIALLAEPVKTYGPTRTGPSHPQDASDQATASK